MNPDSSSSELDSAVKRIKAELLSGLRHGHCEITLVGDSVGRDRRRLVIKAGKNYRFFIDLTDINR